MTVVSERDRMVAGERYLADDAELVAERARARALLARYNATLPSDPDARASILGELLADVGKEAWIEPPFFCDYGWNVSIGDRAFLNFNCVVLDVAPVAIGVGTQIGPGVQLCAATHPLHPRDREAGWEYGRPIDIGGNVWIGAAAVVGPGVAVGDDSVIGAGSVVLSDIPAGVLAVGSPARVVRAL